MAKKIYKEEDIQDIANAIREKNGEETTYKPSEMGDAIRKLGISEGDVLRFAIEQTTEPSTFHHITDSANYRVLDFGMEGITEQETTNGNSLIPLLEGTTKTVIGVETVIGNGTISYNGTATSSSGRTVPLSELKVLQAGTYYFVVDTTLSGLSFYVQDTSNAIISKANATFTLAEDTEVYIGANFTKDTTYKGSVNVMVNSGSTALAWEPFTNGASPNPDYKQPITLAGVLNEETGRYEHKCCVGNKNWFDESKLTGGEFVEFNGVRCYKYRDNTDYIYYNGKFSPNAQYTITMRLYRESNDSTKHTNITLEYIDGSEVNIVLTPGDIVTYTSTAGKSVSCIKSSASYSTVTYLDLSVMQIERGLTPTNYTPHASQQFTLTSPVPLTKWDNLVKRDGVWGCGIKGKKRIFDGTEEWFQDGKMVRLLRWDDGKTLKHSNAQVLGFYSNIAIEGTGASGSEIDYTFSTHNYLGVDWILFKFEIAVDDWKAYLAEQYANGTPVYVQYHTAEEQAFIPLPDEEQILLNKLETYYGVTNVYNEQGCPMWIKYVADTKLYVDKKLLEIQSAMI